jgi:YD repeat-containing protein
MTGDGTRTFEWGARNQFVAVVEGTHRSEFTYDGFQRRVRIIELDSSVVVSDTRFVWCDSVICEERAANGTTVLRRPYVRGVEVGSADRMFTIDHLGSVREVTDATGAVLARYAFDPFERRTIVSGNRRHPRSGSPATVGTTPETCG